ncbi:MAG: DUF6029 family protein [Candidatus Neomarinimicrobiota bacterium]|nr:DUF6029 family protein [Candidatus Neomarinimicrobiota bacterium]
MNKRIISIFLCTTLTAQVEYSNNLNIRYGEGDNNYTYEEIYFNTGIILNRPDDRFEALFSLELSDPPEIGLKEEGIREFLLGYYNKNLSIELGDFYQTWGRGLILNQTDYQHLDFNTSATGLSVGYEKDYISLNVIAGETNPRKSTTFLGDYDPRVPNYILKQTLYGSDLSIESPESTMGLSILFTEEEEAPISSVIGGIRFEKPYDNGDFFLSFISKRSKFDIVDSGSETDKGNGLYFSNTNYIKDWALTSNYRRYRIDVKDPSMRDNILSNYGQALDVQRSPTGYYQHSFKLLSRNSKQVNLNDEIGLELELIGPIDENRTLLVNYTKSSSTKGWHNEFGYWEPEPLTTTNGNSNSLFPSSDKDSYPFDEIFIELNGYNKAHTLFYRVGFDYFSDTFAVLANSNTSESFEVNKAITFPFMVNVILNDLWSIEVQLELQRAKKGFEVTTNDESSFVSLLSEKYQDNIFLGFTVNHAPWSLTVATESTNSDESLSNFDSNTWNSVALTYRIKSDNILEVFYGSIRGGLDCTNGVCRYIQPLKNGLRIDYSVNLK